MFMKITPTEAAVGAFVSDIDVSHPLSEKIAQTLQTAFHQYSLLIFRGQTLTEPDQVRFAQHFCNPVQHPTNTVNRGALPEITIISNTDEGALGNAEVHFHADLIFLDKPGTVSVLYCLETPNSGGDTHWTGNIAAYKALDEKEKHRLEDLKIAYVHSRSEYNQTEPPRHPIVSTHPESKQKSLYFSPNHAKWVEGLAKSESEQIISFLTSHLTSEQFTFSHQWQPGDLVMWDNRSTMHRRDSFDNTQLRIMKRAQAVGLPSKEAQ